MTEAKELVGPVPSVRFHDGTVIAYQPPRDTVDDDRWSNCHEHRVACDCREAELAEQIAELRSELETARRVARRILTGHATHAYEDSPTTGDGSRPVGCMCTGCRIARGAYLLRHSDADSFARDEVDGLTDEQIAEGLRWKPFFGHVGPDCLKALIRYRDQSRYHEHIVRPDGSLVEDPDPIEVPF